MFVGWSGKNKKGHYWEIQTMLLILCPDIMFKVAKSETTKETATKEKFMHNLNKALKGKLADIAVVCYVNIFKASTFVTKQDSSALRFTVTAIEPELKERLFNPASPFKPSDGNEVQIMTDCLLASFRLSHVKVILRSSIIGHNTADHLLQWSFILRLPNDGLWAWVRAGS